MAEYDQSFRPPPWWFLKLDEAKTDLDLSDGEVIAAARELDARESDGDTKRWDASRMSKMRTEGKATIQLVVAISLAMKIPAPVVVPKNGVEAEAIDRWLADYRRKHGQVQSGSVAKVATISQVLDAAVKAKTDQTPPLPSPDEGSPRSPRTRRAPRSR